MGKQVKYSPEVRERAVRMFQEHVHEHPSRWAAMQSIAGKIGCTTQSLSTWVRRAEEAADPRRNAALADRTAALASSRRRASICAPERSA